MIRHFRTKVVDVRAVQWDGNNLAEMNDFAGADFSYDPTPDSGDDIAAVRTARNSSWEYIYLGDWVLMDDDRRLSVCQADEFAGTYEQGGEASFDDDQARRLAHPRAPKPLPYGSIDGDKTMRDFMTDLHDVSGIGDPTLRRRIAEGLWVMGYEREPYKAIAENGGPDA